MTALADRIRGVLETAVWAPSGDNSQPWYFTLHGETVRVHLLPDLDNRFINFKLSGTYIAHGALIENIVLAAPLSGLVARVQILPDSSDPFCTAEILFEEKPGEIDSLAQVIRERHTNRKQCEKKPIDSKILASLAEAAQSVQGSRLALIGDRDAISRVAHASALMEQIALETPNVSALFFGSILWSERENREGAHGLYIKAMELPAPVQLIFPYLAKPRVAAIANRFGFSKIVRKTNAALYASSPAIGLVTMDAEHPASYIAAGRATERVWLEATKHGLAFQPVTGLLFIARTTKNATSDHLVSRYFQEIENAAQSIQREFSIIGGAIPAMMFRMGYAPPATARSFRHALDVRPQ